MRRTKKDAEQTREDILDAAVCLFSERGIQTATLDEIASKVGVTRGAVYWHFENKMDIFDALHERLHRPFIGIILENLEKNHAHPLQQLRDLWIQLFLNLEKDEKKRQALILFKMKCDYSGDLKQYKQKHDEKKKESVELFKSYLKKAMESGSLPQNTDPDLLIDLISCFMRGLLTEYLESPANFDLKNRAPKLINRFFDGIERGVSCKQTS